MIRIKEDTYFIPSKLALIKGENISEQIEKEILATKITEFGDSVTPKEAMSKMQDTDKVDYEYCFPITGGICVSDKCQLRCNYCAYSSEEEGLSIITMDKAVPFINFLLSNLLMRRLVHHSNDEKIDIYFAGGGEPTYNWSRLVEIVEYIKTVCKSHNVQYTFGITTNSILNDNQLEYIKNNFNLIVVSFDGLPEIQNRNRTFANGKGTFEKVNHSLKYFLESNTPISIRSTIWPTDYSRINDIVEFVLNEYPNVSLIEMEPVNSRGRAADSQRDTLKGDFVDYFISAKEELYKKGLEDKLFCGKFKDAVVDYICGTAYGKNPWLLPNGNIVTCIDAKENSTVVATVADGVLKKNVFKDQITETYLQKRTQCRECFAFSFCGGGCPLRYVYSSEEKNNDEECNMIKKYWLYIFEEILKGKDVLGWEGKDIALQEKGIIAKQIRRTTWKFESEQKK